MALLCPLDREEINTKQVRCFKNYLNYSLHIYIHIYIITLSIYMYIYVARYLIVD